MSMTDDWVNTEELAETDLLHLLVIPIQRTVESLRDGARRDVQRELHHSLMGQANAPNTVKKTRSRRDLSRMIRISYLVRRIYRNLACMRSCLVRIARESERQKKCVMTQSRERSRACGVPCHRHRIYRRVYKRSK
ncbi:unnamed protein product, partial [Trichogramma brassicae]